MWTIIWKTETGYQDAAGEEFRNWDVALMYARAHLPKNKGEPDNYSVPYWVIVPTSKAYDLVHGKN